jgi:hypothetical protein
MSEQVSDEKKNSADKISDMINMDGFKDTVEFIKNIISIGKLPSKLEIGTLFTKGAYEDLLDQIVKFYQKITETLQSQNVDSENLLKYMALITVMFFISGMAIGIKNKFYNSSSSSSSNHSSSKHSSSKQSSSKQSSSKQSTSNCSNQTKSSACSDSSKTIHSSCTDSSCSYSTSYMCPVSSSCSSSDFALPMVNRKYGQQKNAKSHKTKKNKSNSLINLLKPISNLF